MVCTYLYKVRLLSPDIQYIILHVLANSKQDTQIIATATPNITELVAEGSSLSALLYTAKEFTITGKEEKVRAEIMYHFLGGIFG